MKNYIRNIQFNEFPNQKYPFHFKWFQDLQNIEFDTPVTFFVGSNGAGKSTLIEAIAVAYGFNAEGGSLHLRFETKATHSSLYDYITLIRNPVSKPKDGFFLRSETMYNLSTTLSDMGYETLNNYGGDSLHEYSHGESFLAIFMNRIRSRGFYILDEPESGLSPEAQMSLLVRIHELARESGSQFLIATHSPILLAYPKAKIIQLTENHAEEVYYQDVEFVKLYHRVLNDPSFFKRRLFEDEE